MNKISKYQFFKISLKSILLISKCLVPSYTLPPFPHKCFTCLTPFLALQKMKKSVGLRTGGSTGGKAIMDLAAGKLL